MNEEEIFVKRTKNLTDAEIENSLRPTSLDEYIGQTKVKEALSVYIQAAKSRKESLDHVLLYGPPGLGKTTLSHIIANELGSQFKVTSGPAIEHAADEIHRLNPAIEEVLYSAMEDFQLDLIIGEGPSARSVRIDLQPFTLVGATTRSGLLSTPLRERFGIPLRLDFYSPEELMKIVVRGARLLGMPISEDGALEIAKRSRGTPRIANRLLKRVRDYAQVLGEGHVNKAIAVKTLQVMEIDDLGLDTIDRKILLTMINKFGGGPVGLDTLAATISEDATTIEDVYEPYLLQLGFISRTPRGRIVLEGAYKHFGMEYVAK